MRLLELANTASGVQIFIGADNPLFANTGCSMVVAPFRDLQERILGAIGVIGPTRLNYARIIPLVDYTARAIGRMVGKSGPDDRQSCHPVRTSKLLAGDDAESSPSLPRTTARGESSERLLFLGERRAAGSQHAQPRVAG